MNAATAACQRCGSNLVELLHDIEAYGSYLACAGCRHIPDGCTCTTSEQTPDLFMAGAAFVLDAPAEVPAIWGRSPSVLWAPGEALMIAGGNGVGKTTLAHQLLAGRLGLLDQVLGLPIVPGERRVLYLACDRPQQIARAMQRLFSEEHREILNERLSVWKGPPPADFSKNTTLLREMCRRAGADTVFVDSLKDVAVGLSSDEVGSSYNRARQFAIADGVEVVELHHQVKRGANGGKPDTLADVYGSTWITGGTGSVILLWGEPGDPIVEFKHLKQPAEEVGPFKVLHDHDTGRSSVVDSVDLLQVVRNFPHGITVQAAARQMYPDGEPTRAQVEKARRQLDRLVKNGLMIAKDGSSGGAGGGEQKRYFLISGAETKP